MGFLCDRRKHLHWRFIGMDYAMFENSIAQGILSFNGVAKPCISTLGARAHGVSNCR